MRDNAPTFKRKGLPKAGWDLLNASKKLEYIKDEIKERLLQDCGADEYDLREWLRELEK